MLSFSSESFISLYLISPTCFTVDPCYHMSLKSVIILEAKRCGICRNGPLRAQRTDNLVSVLSLTPVPRSHDTPDWPLALLVGWMA
jgi:hypothetical protein